MRGSKWDLIKPLLKTLQEAFPAEIHVALIIKPDNFWQKQKTNFGSSKFIFEVRQTPCLPPFCSSVQSVYSSLSYPVYPMMAKMSGAKSCRFLGHIGLTSYISGMNKRLKK